MGARDHVIQQNPTSSVNTSTNYVWGTCYIELVHGGTKEGTHIFLTRYFELLQTLSIARMFSWTTTILSAFFNFSLIFFGGNLGHTAVSRFFWSVWID